MSSLLPNLIIFFFPPSEPTSVELETVSQVHDTHKHWHSLESISPLESLYVSVKLDAMATWSHGFPKLNLPTVDILLVTIPEIPRGVRIAHTAL